MNNKEIKIKAVLDSSGFDRGVTDLQQKLRQMQQTGRGLGTASEQLGNKTLMGKYAQQAFGDFSKENQQRLEQIYQTQRREAVNQRINMRQRQSEIDELLKRENDLTTEQQKRLGLLKEEVSLLREKHRTTIMTAAETKKALDAAQGTAGGGGGGGDPTGPTGPMGRFGGFLGNMVKFVGAGALLNGAANAVVTGVGDIITRERKITQSQGAALEVASRELREQFQGRGSRGMFWAGERAQAMRMAEQERQGQGLLLGMGTGTSIAGGAFAGAAAGSFIPGIGTAVGAGVGALGGFAARMFGSEKARSQIFDRERYQALMTEEGMRNYEGNLAALRARQPRAAMAQQYFEQNRGQMARTQTMLGIRSDVGLLGGQGMTREEASQMAAQMSGGRPNPMLTEQLLRESETQGFMRGQMGAGQEYGGVRFNQRNILQQAQGIVQAGGTTAGGRGLAGFSAALQRQMGMQNAPQILGQLTGAGLSVNQTEDATKRLMAEAVKIGVDASKMPQEMQRMVAMTAQLATAGGGFAPGAMETAMAGVEGFDKTAIDAAKSAEQLFQQVGKAAGGWEGQMGMGFLQSTEATELAGKKLSSKELNFLNQFSYTEAREQDFQRIGDYLGIDPESAKELVRRKDMFKQTRTEAEQQSLEDLGGFLKEQGQMSPEQLRETLSTGRGAKLFTEAQIQMTARGRGFAQRTQAEQRARILQLARMNVPGLELPGEEGAGPTPMEQVTGQLKAPEERAAFVEEGAEATGDIARIKALNDNLDRLKNASRAHTEISEEYNEQFKNFLEAMRSGAGQMETISKQLEGVVDELAEKGLLSTKPSD